MPFRIASPEDIEKLAERIYKIVMKSHQGHMNIDQIWMSLPGFTDIDDVQQAMNLLIERDVIGWKSVKTYGDTIYVKG